jgi:hypothetical protein
MLGQQGKKRDFSDQLFLSLWRFGWVCSHRKKFGPGRNRVIGELGLQLGFIILLSLTLIYPL